MGDELKGHAGLFQFDDERVGSDEERTPAQLFREVDLAAKPGWSCSMTRGGAASVLEVEPQVVQQDVFDGGIAALLEGFGVVDVLDDFAQGGEMSDCLAAGSEVAGIVLAEGLDVPKHLVAPIFSIVHGGPARTHRRMGYTAGSASDTIRWRADSHRTHRSHAPRNDLHRPHVARHAPQAG